MSLWRLAKSEASTEGAIKWLGIYFTFVVLKISATNVGNVYDLVS
jgi:hypothetical protein